MFGTPQVIEEGQLASLQHQETPAASELTLVEKVESGRQRLEVRDLLVDVEGCERGTGTGNSDFIAL